MITKSADILKGMQAISGMVALCILPHAAMSAMEGVLVAGRDFMYQAISYLVTGGLFLSYQVPTC